MTPLTMFLVFKLGLALAAIAFAVREIIVTSRPDSDPEFTRKLVHVFSAARRARPRVPAPPPPTEKPEAPRQAA